MIDPPRIALPVPPPALIETMRADADGSVPLLRFHLERLRVSCQALGYRCDAQRLKGEITDIAAAAAGSARRLRLLLQPDGQWTLQTAPLPALPARPAVVIWQQRLDPAQALLRHKTTHRPWYDEATLWLEGHPHCFDALFFNQRGELCEGSRSNVYLRVDGLWLTPPTSSGCLPGVQRAKLLESGEVQEALLLASDLHRAQATRLSNGLRGWFDVLLSEMPGEP